MNTPQTTATLAAQVRAAAPGIGTVRMTPVWTDVVKPGRRTVLVTLDDTAGQPLDADRAAHRAVRELILAAYPHADWSHMHAYDVALDRLTALAAPTGPRELTAGTEVTR